MRARYEVELLVATDHGHPVEFTRCGRFHVLRQMEVSRPPAFSHAPTMPSEVRQNTLKRNTTLEYLNESCAAPSDSSFVRHNFCFACQETVVAGSKYEFKVSTCWLEIVKSMGKQDYCKNKI